MKQIFLLHATVISLSSKPLVILMILFVCVCRIFICGLGRFDFLHYVLQDAFNVYCKWYIALILPWSFWAHRLLSVPLLYHSMGQIIKSVFVCLCMYVCMYLWARIFQPIFTKFGKNLWGLNRKNWLGWGRNQKMPSPILAPKTKIFGAWIGISSQICKNFKSLCLQNYTSD